MLFKVDPNKKLRDLNPEIDVIAEFKHVSSKNLEYIFLVYDYESPYRKLPLQQRKEKVGLRVGFKMEIGDRKHVFDKNARDIMNGKAPRVTRAIKAFKELIYDSDKDTYQSVDDLISNIRNDIRQPGKNSQDMKHKAALAKELISLSQTKKQLAQILEIKDTIEDDSEEETTSKSTLEMINDGEI